MADSSLPAVPRRKMGRPTKLTETMAAHVVWLARRGFTNAEIATLKDVTEETVSNWKSSPDFFHFLNTSKKVADQVVARSLYERAVGYDHPEDKVFCEPKTGKVTTVRIVKHEPPDVTACIFWLKNRDRANWRDTPPADAPRPQPIALVVNVNGAEQAQPFLELFQNGHAQSP